MCIQGSSFLGHCPAARKLLQRWLEPLQTLFLAQSVTLRQAVHVPIAPKDFLYVRTEIQQTTEDALRHGAFSSQCEPPTRQCRRLLPIPPMARMRLESASSCVWTAFGRPRSHPVTQFVGRRLHGTCTPRCSDTRSASADGLAASRRRRASRRCSCQGDASRTKDDPGRPRGPGPGRCCAASGNPFRCCAVSTRALRGARGRRRGIETEEGIRRRVRRRRGGLCGDVSTRSAEAIAGACASGEPGLESTVDCLPRAGLLRTPPGSDASGIPGPPDDDLRLFRPRARTRRRPRRPHAWTSDGDGSARRLHVQPLQSPRASEAGALESLVAASADINQAVQLKIVRLLRGMQEPRRRRPFDDVHWDKDLERARISL